MDIKNCNEYRTRAGQAKPETCLQCGLGPCRYSAGELLVSVNYPATFESSDNGSGTSTFPQVANTDLSGNTPRDLGEGTLPPEITRKPYDLTATAYSITAADFGTAEITGYLKVKAAPPTPKLVVHAIAMERIDAGDMIRIETDLKTGMTYARKA